MTKATEKLQYLLKVNSSLDIQMQNDKRQIEYISQQ